MIFVIFLCLLLPISAFAQSYANTGPTTENTGDVGVPTGSSYYINDVKQVLINKWDATSPPDVDDDITGGYTPGSIWVDVTGDNAYICVDNSDGVALWVATESSVYVRAGEAIKKGQAVYISGALGAARPTVSLADADDSAKIRILGLAAQDIASGSDGMIRLSGGLIKGVDTEGATDVNPGDEDWTAGDRLYVMLDGSGALTNVRPTSGRVIVAGYTQLGDHNSDTLFVATHVNPADLSTAVGEDIRFRLGAADGSTAIIIKDYADAEVAKIDDNGDADFNSLILDTALSAAEGGTGVANGAGETITLVGDDAIQFTTGGATTVTLPTTGTLLANVSEDTTPELGGQLQSGAHSINFTEQVLTSGTAVAWDLGNSNKATLTAGHNPTITITAPTGALNAQLIVTQDGTGSRILDEIVTQSDATIIEAEVHTDTEIIDLTVDIPTGARIRFATSGVIPTPIVAGTIYWAIRTSANHIKVATTKAFAMAGTAVDITDDGTDTQTVQQLAKWTGGTLGVLSTAAGAEDILALTYKTADKQWYVLLSKDFY